MATPELELVSMELPTGELVDLEIPTGWSDAQVREYATSQGLFSETAEAAPVDVPKNTQPELADAPSFFEDERPDDRLNDPSLGERFVRQQELGARAIGRGVVGAGDIVGMAVGGVPGLPTLLPSQGVDQLLDIVGFARPETAGERMAGTAIEFGAGTVAGVSSAGTLPSRMAATMQAQSAQQIVGGVAAGTAVGVAQEQGVGPWGQLAIGLIGGMSGAVAADRAVIRYGKWADARMETGQPVTPAELEAATKSHGIDMTPEQLGELSDQMNRIGGKAQVEAATIDLMHNPKTAMSITEKQTGGKRTLTKAEKATRRSIREAFIKNADKADDQARQVNWLVQDRAHRAAQADIERQFGADVPNAQMAEAMKAAYRNAGKGNPPTVVHLDEMKLKEIQRRQDAELARLEQEASEAVNPQQTGLRNAAEERAAANAAEIDDVLYANPETIRTKAGEIRATQTFGQKLIKRVHQISPRLGMSMRKVETTSNRLTAADIQAMPRWLAKTGPIARAFNKSATFRSAVDNVDRVKMDQIVPGSSKIFDEEVAPILARNAAVLKANGLPVLDDMYPRAVKSVKKARKALGREQKGKLKELLAAEAKRLGRKLNEDETAGVIGQLIGGRPVRQDRSRRVLEVTEAAERFYVDPRAALIDNLHSHHKAAAKQQFFKNTLGEDLPLHSGLTEGNIGHVLQRSLDAGTLSADDVHEAARLVGIYYGTGQQAPSQTVQFTKNAVTFTTLGFNPYSTVTQTGDLFINGARFGTEAIKRLFPGKKGEIVADAYNAGVRELSSEMRTQEGLAKAVRHGLEKTGFADLDRKFADSGTKAAFAKRVKDLKKDRQGQANELRQLFGDRDAVKVMEDLEANRMSDDVAALIANDVADVRPQGGLDMPVHYNKHPNGRLAYSLLSWSINQVNFVRNNALHVIERGFQRNDVKMIAKGAKTLAAMTMLFAAGGGAANTVKDAIKTTISGEPFDPVDSFEKGATAGAIPLGLAGKFLIEGLQSGRKGFADTLPVISLVNQAGQSLVKFLATGNPAELLEATTLTRNIKDLATGSGIISDAEANAHATLGPQLGMQERMALAAEQDELRTQVTGARRLPDETTPEQTAAMAPKVSVPKNADKGQQFIKKHESMRTVKGGFKGGKWHPYGSIEGGTDTIAHGHKLTPKEVKTGLISIAGEDVPVEGGLTEEQANDLLAQDMQVAEQAIAELVEPELNQNQKTALTSLIFNVGVNSFKKSKARKALNAGDMETFFKEAFSVKHGWTKVKGKVVTGLVKRRKAEEKLFKS